MSGETLLVELFTEELPPKALKRIGNAFAQGIAGGLESRGLLTAGFVSQSFATPRRLAVLIKDALAKATDRQGHKKLMPASVAFDAKGNSYIADSYNARIRKVDPSGIISTFGPAGTPGTDYYNSVVVTPDGTLYLGWSHSSAIGTTAYIAKVGTDGSFTTVAGNGKLCRFTRQPEYPNGPALNAPLCSISGMRSDAEGNLYITDVYYGVILKLAAGNLTRVAGSAVAIDSNEGSPLRWTPTRLGTVRTVVPS